MTAAQFEFPGFAPNPGHRHAHYGEPFPPDGIPNERIRLRRNSCDRGRLVVIQPDLFGALDIATDDAAVKAADETCANTAAADMPLEAALIEDAADQVGSRETRATRQPAEAQSLENPSDQRQEIVIDPTTLLLPANARSRVAGDVVICSTPPATFAEALELLAASGTLSEERMKELRRDVTWVEERRPRNRDGSIAAPLPCDPQALRPILKTLKYDRRKTGAKRLYNIRGSLAAIQRKTGWLAPRAPRAPITTTAWVDLLKLMDNEDRSRPTMRRFAVFCEAQGVQPSTTLAESCDAGDFWDSRIGV